jgi:GNAT superfamily N-acetyltransferase
VESGASWQELDGVAACTYSFDLIHPWPREFSYRSEFFAQSPDAAAVLSQIYAFFGPEPQEHVLTVFGHDGSEVEERFERHGYHLAWSNMLMARALSADAARPSDGVGSIRPMSSESDVAEANAIKQENPSSLAAIDDAHLHDYVAEVSGTIVGKAQIVTVNSRTAYVSDMYVRPDHRRMGLGGRLLEILHTSALTMGAGEMILVPSLMTRQVAFYERFGYRDVVSMHLLIPGNMKRGKT